MNRRVVHQIASTFYKDTGIRVIFLPYHLCFIFSTVLSYFIMKTNIYLPKFSHEHRMNIPSDSHKQQVLARI